MADIRSELPPLLHLALPLIAGELGWIAMSVVDTMMLGRLPHSALAMSAAALAQVLFNTLCFGVGGILLGLDALMAQALGARQQDEANRWLWQGLAMACVLAALLGICFGFGPALLRLLPADPAIVDLAIPAMHGLNWGVLPLMLYFTLRRYLQAAHHGRWIAFALISANAVNLAGNWLLIYGHGEGHSGPHFGSHLSIPAFGVVGSSWATSFARLYLMLVCAIGVWVVNRRHNYGLGRVTRQLERPMLRQMLQLGVPVGASIFVEISIFALVTSVIATFGRLQLAGHEIALQCASTTFMVPLAISSATAVRVGHAIGRMKIGQATAANVAAAGWSGIGAGAAFMLVTSVLFLVAPAPIARLFTPDAAVIAAAIPLLLIAAGFQFFDGVQITASGALRGAGDTTTGLWTQLVCYWAVGMPLGWWLAAHRHMGAAGWWWGLLVALVGAAFVLVWRWHRTTPPIQTPITPALAL